MMRGNSLRSSSHTQREEKTYVTQVTEIDWCFCYAFDVNAVSMEEKNCVHTTKSGNTYTIMKYRKKRYMREGVCVYGISYAYGD